MVFSTEPLASSLLELTLNAQQNLPIGDADSDGLDFEGANYIMATLHSKKCGAPFNKVAVHLDCGPACGKFY
ncbi:hypothetical protein ACEPPN_003330 [Leptodophora sp. 'Broadleaf-Isolate-01']